MVKVCSKCKIEKEYFEFHKNKTSKDGLRSGCKSCREEQLKKYYQYNKERINEFHKRYYQSNKESIKKSSKQYREANKERIKEHQKKYYQSNKESIKKNSKQYYKSNKERINEYKKQYIKQRKKTEPLFKISCNLRNITYMAFKRKGYSKNTKTKEMLGVDWEVAKQYIERKFTKGMNWSNYGEWHIDHIIPLASAKTPERLKQLCHYTNLQPLWAEDNLSKSDSINGQQTMIRI